MPACSNHDSQFVVTSSSAILIIPCAFPGCGHGGLHLNTFGCRLNGRWITCERKLVAGRPLWVEFGTMNAIPLLEFNQGVGLALAE